VLSLEGVRCPWPAQFDTLGPALPVGTRCQALLPGALPESSNRWTWAALKSKERRFAILATVAFDDIDEAPARSLSTMRSRRLKDAGAGDRRTISFEGGCTRRCRSACVLYTARPMACGVTWIEANPDAMYGKSLKTLSSGESHSGPDYVAALGEKLNKIRVEYLKAVAGFECRAESPPRPCFAAETERRLGNGTR